MAWQSMNFQRDGQNYVRHTPIQYSSWASVRGAEQLYRNYPWTTQTHGWHAWLQSPKYVSRWTRGWRTCYVLNTTPSRWKRCDQYQQTGELQTQEKRGKPPPTHQWPKWDLESLVGQLFPTVELVKPSPIPFIRTRQDFQELYRPLPFLGTTHLPPPRPAKIYFSQMLNERARLLQHVTWRIGYLLEIPSKTINTWINQDCQFNIQYTQIIPPNVSTVLHRCNTDSWGGGRVSPTGTLSRQRNARFWYNFSPPLHEAKAPKLHQPPHGAHVKTNKPKPEKLGLRGAVPVLD